MRRGRGLVGLEMDEATTSGAMGRVPTPPEAGRVRPPRRGPRDGRGDDGRGLPGDGGRSRLRRGGRMDAMAVSALLDTVFDMDGATAAMVFRTLRWTRRRRPTPWDADRPSRTPSLSVGPRRMCPSSSMRALRWTRRRRLRPSWRRRMRLTPPGHHVNKS